MAESGNDAHLNKVDALSGGGRGSVSFASPVAPQAAHPLSPSPTSAPSQTTTTATTTATTTVPTSLAMTTDSLQYPTSTSSGASAVPYPRPPSQHSTPTLPGSLGYLNNNNAYTTDNQGNQAHGLSSPPHSHSNSNSNSISNSNSPSSNATSIHESSPDPDDASSYQSSINFVYANDKRFTDFHSLFRSVPEEEKLIEDYGCALQKEILVQGRLYISENHICFNANIFGWVTNLVIAFSEVTAIEKRMTAFVIPNAISIVTTTNTKGHFFASFLSRDAAHDLLIAGWRKSFPCAANASVSNGTNQYLLRQSRSNLTMHDDDDAQSFSSGRTDSRKNRHRRSFSNASQHNWMDEGEWDEEEADKSNTGLRRRGSKRAVVKKLLKDVIAPIIPDDDKSGTLTPNKRTGRGRSVSELPPRPTSFDGGAASRRESIATSRSSLDQDVLSPAITRARAATEVLSGPQAALVAQTANDMLAATRKPTTCKCSKDGRHYANQFMSETYPGTVEGMWKLLFDSDFNKAFLTSDAMKGADVQEEKWNKGSDGNLTKVTKYTKWLGMPIGPKTTKAILTDVCEHKNFDDYVTTVTTTSTPDVPSGGSFTTKCRTCVTWAGPNQVQVVVTGAVEFSKSSWIKGQIEKGAAEGMGTHYKELHQAIRKHIAAHAMEFAGSNSGARERAPAAVAMAVPAAASVAPVPVQLQEKQQQQEQPPMPVKERSGKSSNREGLWESLVQTLQSTARGEGASHAALISILLLVMVANVYIWYQISSISSQIEQIQVDLIATDRSGGKAGSSPSDRYVDVDREQEDLFIREQEEAMWAWLTEREVMRNKASKKYDDYDYDHAEGLSETEAKLQAKIDELQAKLEALERQTSSAALDAHEVDKVLSS
ncbi:hypothetical protein CPC16_009153 [Podila verticillata]|nr:hypothetical protein CPC16_009153 [Podila verticillata]